MTADDDGDAAPAKDPRRTRWLSQTFEHLAAEAGSLVDEDRLHADVVIVGSGYGGAVAAERLSRTTMPDGMRPRVIVLERGLEYLPGSFPTNASELPRHLRWVNEARAGAVGNLEGLFDARIGPDVSVLVASGLGGGSLINAAMMLWPEPHVFSGADSGDADRDSAWPQAIRDEAADPGLAGLVQRAKVLKRELGASVPDGSDGWRDNVVPHVPGDPPAPRGPGGAARVDAMAALDGCKVPLTILMADGASSAGVARRGCIGCGDCASGCNHEAKLSLDVTLLRRAHVQAEQRKQALRIVCGATVSKFARRAHGHDGWVLDVWPTDAARRARSAGALKLHAAKVIVAAGTLGSTELLLRSQTDGLHFSPKLGTRFSANGDMIAAVDRSALVLNSVAHGTIAPAERGVGPTNTSIVDWRDGRGGGCVVEDMAVPAVLCRLFEEAVTTTGLLHDLDRRDDERYDPAGAHLPDPQSVDPERIDRSLTVALIVRDAAEGRIALRPEVDERLPADAGVRIDWPNARFDPALARAHAALQGALDPRPGRPPEPVLAAASDALRRRLHAASPPWNGGRVLANPLWRPLPPDLTRLLEIRKGPLVSVHPLGGCPMGEDVRCGVVADDGAVFDADVEVATAGTVVHEGLAVLDGAIVPTSLGINPSLTIAALADRGIHRLAARWGWTIAPAQPPLPTVERPRRRAVDPALACDEPPTQVQALERLSGRVWLRDDPRPVDERGPLWVVLDLIYRDEALFPRANAAPRRPPFVRAGHVLPVLDEPHLSRLRIYATVSGRDPPRFDEPDDRDGALLFEAPVLGGTKHPKSGSTLTFLGIEHSDPKKRGCRAIRAWALNRLGVDAVAYVRERFGRARRSRYEKGPDPDTDFGTGSGASASWLADLGGVFGDLRRRWVQARILATHAGVVRTFDYELHLGAPRIDLPALPPGLSGLAVLREQLRPALAGVFTGMANSPNASPHASPHASTHASTSAIEPTLRLVKRLTYARRSSPLRQLMRADIERLGTLLLADDPDGRRPMLEVDPAYFARKAFPLLRVTKQRDQPMAIVELACFAMYLARVVVAIHLWSFRRPTGFAPNHPRPRRAGHRLDRVYAPLSVRVEPDGTHGDGQIELTRYPRDRKAMARHGSADATARAVPVLLIHGYSAASSTFAHPALRPGLAGWLWEQGFEPWTVDLRTSSALATSSRPWTFEEIALGDVTTAIREVCARTGAERIDVVTHCMGGAMLAMALLADDPRALAARSRVRRWVMSQVGPAMLFDPGNTLRAYLAGWLRWLLPNHRHSFHPSRDASLYDRAIHAMPYLDDRTGTEFDIESPPLLRNLSPRLPRRGRPGRLFADTSWVGYRHRVDAMLGRAFDARRVDDAVLERLDDFFGPINLQTLAQAMHFARFAFVAAADGLEPWGVGRLARLRDLPMLSLHARDSGLVHPETERVLRRLADAYRLPLTTLPISRRGHQDMLIGRGCDVDVFPKIRSFLEAPDDMVRPR